MEPQRRSAAPSAPITEQEFLSFDGGVRALGLLQRPDRYRHLQPQSFPDTAIPRGAGLSYAPASFRHDALSVEHTSFSRVLGIDSVEKIIDVEAGISLAGLYDILAPRGLYLPTQPGHGLITIGGCIAADAHGKNQARDGTFIEQVESLILFHPEHGILDLSRDKESELFRLTCGGYGLTGHIISARLRAKPIRSNLVELEFVPVENVLAGADQLKRAAQRADFVITWHDFTVRGAALGPGLVQEGRFLTSDDGNMASSGPAAGLIGAPPALSATTRGRWRMCLLNGSTTRVLNAIYRWKQTAGRSAERVPLHMALFPAHQTQFYYKLFGTRGFHEYQVIVPIPRFEEFVTVVQDHLNHYRCPITLASAKLFRGQSELLRFTGDGICLALNFPRGKQASRLLALLDEITVATGAIPNIIKDSRLPRTVVEATYPGIAQFRERLRAFDPKRRFRSELSERLAL